MSRSKWKFNFICKNNLRFVFFKKSKLKKKNKLSFLKLKVFNKSSMLFNLLFKDVINVHRGLYFKVIKYNSIFNKFRFGEFIFTRKNFFFPKKVNKGKNNSKKGK